jgi:4-alpha-glucanotransferase
MGLFRLFWIAHGLPPSEGAYVRYPADELLAIVALESQRAGATVVGEDLGTVEEGVRERLAAHGILSYRVAWFEERPPVQYPELAMAAVTTHDLPTIGGLWTGADLAELRRLGLVDNDAALDSTRARLAQLAGLADDAAVPDVIEAVHARLAQAPSLLVTATLDDALAVSERPNVPGTSFERANWSIALPLTLEALETASLPRRIAATLGARRR